MLRGIVRGIVYEWVWYDQLFLFGGAFLLILGILMFVFRNRKWLGAKAEAGNEQRELLDFYERQKANWRSYIRLKLVKVESYTKAASPYLVLTLEVHNYLPISFNLVRVSETEGSVGQCNLPRLPENIDKKIGACTEDQFEIRVDVHGTKIPEFLESKEAPGKPCLLQWYLKGVWYADIYGKTQPIKYKADSLWCECLLSIRE